MDNPQGILRTGDRATVEFEFMTQPEFIKAGMKLLFREGKTKVSLMVQTGPLVCFALLLLLLRFPFCAYPIWIYMSLDTFH